MRIELIKQYELGDMIVEYKQNTDSGMVGMSCYPNGIEIKEHRISLDEPYVHYNNFATDMEPLVNISIFGAKYNESVARSLRSNDTYENMSFGGQASYKTGDKTIVETILNHSNGWKIIHVLEYYDNAKSFFCHNVFHNTSDRPVILELFSSVCIGEISPFENGIGDENLNVHRLRSKWSREAKHEVNLLEDLHLERSWINCGHPVERFGVLGSKANFGFASFCAIEDIENSVFWGVSLMHAGSWQMEIARMSDYTSLSAGLADRDFGGWFKEIRPGQVFSSPKAIVSCARTDFDTFSQRITTAINNELVVPQSEEDLPVIFNEYCTTWGKPSHDNLMEALEGVRGLGITYFVIDAGWYVSEKNNWGESIGDWIPSDELFPKGLKHTVEKIREEGLIPGIWFEFECCGNSSELFSKVDHLLKLNGYTLNLNNRHLLDLSDEFIKEYLYERVIQFLKEHDFQYLKIDYNTTIGIGCDGDGSIGENLRRNIESLYEFLDRIRTEIPALVIENCASGGQRIEPSMLVRTSMSSFSDAHELPEIPIIAADSIQIIQPRQMQIWAVIRKEHTADYLKYKLASTFIGRMCISGDVVGMSQEQRKLVKSSILFYKKAADIIKNGNSVILRGINHNTRRPKGCQVVLRENTAQNRLLAVVTTFDGQYVPVKLPAGYEIDEVMFGEKGVEIVGDMLYCNGMDVFNARVVIFIRSKKKEEAVL